MSGDFLPNAAGFELAQHELQQCLSDLRKVAIANGTPRELLGLRHENGVPLEYTFSIDPGVAQQLFHPRDRNLRVKDANLAYQTPSPHDPGVDETVMEYVTVTIDSDMMATEGMTIQECLVIAKEDEKLEAYIDIDYLDKNGRLIDLTGRGSDTTGPSAEEDAVINAIALRRPLMIADIEAMEQLGDILSA